MAVRRGFSGLIVGGMILAQTSVVLAAPSAATAATFLRSRIGATGLLDSYVEDNVDTSYTYDNAMAALAFLSLGDFVSARRVLDAFFLIPADASGGFFHRYQVGNGQPLDGIVYAGSNTYLLQAFALYKIKTGDTRYRILAQQVGNFLISLQKPNGGLVGRPGVTWQSTEHNLGAYTALQTAATAFTLPNFATEASQIRTFLTTYCWNGTRWLQGFNDPTIVTDVQALGTMVLGKTYSNGTVWVESYTKTTKRYSGSKRVTGFDADDNRDVVWTEGTLQQSLAYFVRGNLTRSNTYRSQSEKLAQASGAFWLGSNVGTAGPDWILQRWQSVAPTAWYILAVRQDNILAPRS